MQADERVALVHTSFRYVNEAGQITDDGPQRLDAPQLGDAAALAILVTLVRGLSRNEARPHGHDDQRCRDKRRQHVENAGMANAIDEETGDERPQHVGDGPAQGDHGVVGGAPLRPADAAHHGLQRQAEHLVREAHDEGHQAEHHEVAEEGRQQQHRHHGHAARDHRQVRWRTVGVTADDDGQGGGAEGKQRNDDAHGKLARSQVQCVQRHQHAAAAETNLAEQAHQYDEVERHGSGITKSR